jgi:hypothetical protein
MSARVRLPLTKLSDHSKGEIASILTYLRERYADDVLASDRDAEPIVTEQLFPSAQRVAAR